MKKKSFLFDIESFANTFTFVAESTSSDERVEFIIYENDEFDQLTEFFYWLYKKPKLIGYNNLGYDAHVVEKIWRDKISDARKIFEYSSQLIKSKDEDNFGFKPWEFSFKHLDLMKMNNYTIYGKPTSLKWLEFTMRMQSIQDLPYDFDTELTEDQAYELLAYNVKDVVATKTFFLENINGIKMRQMLSEQFSDKFILNQPNASIGEKIILYSYADKTGKDHRVLKKSKGTKRKEIVVKDIILPYLNFKLPIFKEVKRDFENLVLKANKDGVINLKGVYEKEIEFQNMNVKYALGGIHGCVPSGIYKSTDTHIIKTYDVTSMYPNLAIGNRFYPESLGEVFCDVYGSILERRKLYPKSTDLEMNLAYKEAANSVYGKSNSSRDNFLKDPKYTLQTTINGQLALSLLGERLSEIGEFIMWNTDGSEILIPRDKEEEYNRICDEWCKLTNIELEHDNYDTMWVRDVNNYIAKFESGKVKRKGMFAIYDDYKGNWDKNPSALIIPEAINAYFIEGKDPGVTITNWNNIHDFLFGVKGGNNFEYWSVSIEDNAVTGIERHKERAIRYYCSTKGNSILKNWVGGKKLGDLPSAVPNTKGQKIQMLLNIPDKKGEVFRERREILKPRVMSEPDENGRRSVIEKGEYQTIIESRYPDLDYDYYIREAWRWINMIENKEFTPSELE